MSPGIRPILDPGGRVMPEHELPLGFITLTTHSAELNLSDTMEHVRRVAVELETAMRAQHGNGVPTSGSDILVGVSIEFGSG